MILKFIKRYLHKHIYQLLGERVDKELFCQMISKIDFSRTYLIVRWETLLLVLFDELVGLVLLSI